MFETHERILQILGESGHKEFSSEMIKKIIDRVEGEEVDKMHEEWLRETDPYAIREGEVVSWEDAAEDLSEIPYRESSREIEMER